MTIGGRYMEVYQHLAEEVMTRLPKNDEDISERGQKQLDIANTHAVLMLNALANIISLCDNPEIDEDELYSTTEFEEIDLE